MIFSGLIIPISMIVFSLLCIKNVKQLQTRVHPNARILSLQTTNVRDLHQNIANKKTDDYQLIFMVLVQQFVYLITNLPFISYLFYIVITINWNKSNLQLSIESFCYNIFQILVFFNFSLTFYIYTFTASKFRKDLKKLLFHNHLMNMIFGIRQNR